MEALGLSVRCKVSAEYVSEGNWWAGTPRVCIVPVRAIRGTLVGSGGSVAGSCCCMYKWLYCFF